MKNHVLDDVPFHKTNNCGGEISPKMITIHYTGGRTLMSSVRWFKSERSMASAHVLIGRDRKIVQMVPFNVKAWHAGKSSYKGETSCNNFSIGIELCNWGELIYKNGVYKTWSGGNVYDEDVVKLSHKLEPHRQSFWERYQQEQIDSCIKVCKRLCDHYPIECIVGHDDIAVPRGRKKDPGPALDMKMLNESVGLVQGDIVDDQDEFYKELILVRDDMKVLSKRIDRILNRRDD